MTRRNVAIAVLVLWAIALGMLAHKQFGKGDTEQLADATARLDPATYYYLVYQGDTPIGSASSEIDSAIGPQREFRLTDHFRGRIGFRGKSRFINASLTAYLSPKFIQDSFTLAVSGDRQTMRLRRTFPKSPTAPLPPELVPMMFLMSGRPELGRSRSYPMYDPLGDSTVQVTFRVAAESLFTVSDSAKYDSTAQQWVSAHSDTVRSWSIAPSHSGFTIWADTQGRIVSARSPTGLRLIRTAYEIAFANSKFR